MANHNKIVEASQFDLPAVRRAWRQEVVSEHAWTRDDERKADPGEAGGFRVKCPTFPYGGYLKPTKVEDPSQHPRAAYEKIAADLAYELDLTFPPVLLYRRQDASEGEETRTCISLVLYPEHYEWGLFWNGVAAFQPAMQAQIQAALVACSGNLALDYFLGNTDRNNARNVVLGTSADKSDPGVFYFLDNANTLDVNGRWTENCGRIIDPVAIPQIFRDNLDRAAVQAAAERIAGLDDEQIREVVRRIPDDFMPALQKQVVTSSLINRKALIPGSIGASL